MKLNNSTITKASGHTVPFSEDKLRRSLRKVGAGEEDINRIIGEIETSLYEGISTKKIYRIAFKLLKESSRNLAAKYHLKQAIMELGPSGYPFEKFVGEILRYQGYKIQVGVIVQGSCVSHEIDVIAEKEHHHFMIECKFHNQQGIFCDVKIPLYIQSRFKDIESQWKQLPGHATKFHQGWLVTNTRFSNDAIQYGTCAGLKMIGWDYPEQGSLKNMVDSLGLYPITCLTSISRAEKQHLLDRRIVLCKELADNKNLVLQAGVSEKRLGNVMDEVYHLCQFMVSK